jgi:hypothetical protein
MIRTSNLRRLGWVAVAVVSVCATACGRPVTESRVDDRAPGVVLRPTTDVTPEVLAAAADALRERLTSSGFPDAPVDVDTANGTVRIDVEASEVAELLEQIQPEPVRLRPAVVCKNEEQTWAPAPSTGAIVSPEGTELLPSLDGGECFVGPAGATGTVFEPDAVQEIISGGWGVIVSLRPGADGADQLNVLASMCFERNSDCPTGRLAIEVDGLIVSSPSVNVPEFLGSVQITGTFTEAEARHLAAVLVAGAIGVEWIVASTPPPSSEG